MEVSEMVRIVAAARPVGRREAVIMAGAYVPVRGTEVPVMLGIIVAERAAGTHEAVIIPGVCVCVVLKTGVARTARRGLDSMGGMTCVTPAGMQIVVSAAGMEVVVETRRESVKIGGMKAVKIVEAASFAISAPLDAHLTVSEPLDARLTVAVLLRRIWRTWRILWKIQAHRHRLFDQGVAILNSMASSNSHRGSSLGHFDTLHFPDVMPASRHVGYLGNIYNMLFSAVPSGSTHLRLFLVTFLRIVWSCAFLVGHH